MDFFRRQFSPEITEQQFRFDVLFGIFAPILCIAIDLSIFDGIIVNSPVFSKLSFTLSIIALTVWLVFNSKIQFLWSSLITGILLSGAVYASVLAFLVGSFTVWGFAVSILIAELNWIIVGSAILGFLPIFTAFVFIRNGFRAIYHLSQKKTEKLKLVILVLLSGTIMLFLTRITLAQY